MFVSYILCSYLLGTFGIRSIRLQATVAVHMYIHVCTTQYMYEDLQRVVSLSFCDSSNSNLRSIIHIFFFAALCFHVIRLAKLWSLDIINSAAKYEHWTIAALLLFSHISSSLARCERRQHACWL